MKTQFNKKESSYAKKHKKDTSTLKAQLHHALEMKDWDKYRAKSLSTELESAIERCIC